MTYPIYIPSRGRSDINGTGALFESLGLESFTFVVEEDERDIYAERWGADRVVVRPQSACDRYDPLDGYGQEFPLGSGPSRNHGWDLAEKRGAPWHWIVDDNITGLLRWSGNDYTMVRDAPRFIEGMERYLTQFVNLAMGGPVGAGLIPGRQKHRRITRNSRVYSFNLIRTDAPFRWRGRYNEDTILSLDMLSRGWATILLRQWQMAKAQTRTVKGGNTSELYRHGTGPKSRLLARVHPKYVKMGMRFNRLHHYIDYHRHFGHIPLIHENGTRW